MADFPEPMLTGSATATGLAPVVLATGITFPAAWNTANTGYKNSHKGVTAYNMAHTFTIPELQLDCLTAIGYVPNGVTVIGFIIRSADLDGGSPALVQAVYLGSTSLVAGLTLGQGGTSGIYGCVPTGTTGPTAVYLKVTTAAATAQAGEVNITALYYST